MPAARNWSKPLPAMWPAVRHLVIDALPPEQLDRLTQAGEIIVDRAAFPRRGHALQTPPE
ncbi:hypothetical protein ACFWWT_35555 [Streptomyces sp. NPDC058676]|uniref:hypothetical protein n=1 Tax=unclassified Streptomyces TaxID=2593676 RepID=UPI0036649F62